MSRSTSAQCSTFRSKGLSEMMCFLRKRFLLVCVITQFVHLLWKFKPATYPFSNFRRLHSEQTYSIHKFYCKNFFTRQWVCPVTLYNHPQGAKEGGEHMSQSERRQRLLEVLCLRRYDTCANLAQEFHVCQRTIRYDIEALMCSYPVETVCGRFGGGVRVMEGYYYHRKPSPDNTLNLKQTALLRRLRKQLMGDDRDTIDSILVQFAP